MAVRLLVSAGEASGDLYAAQLVEALRRRNPAMQFYGCAGPRMRSAGVEAVVDSSALAVAGLVEVVTHIPRIYGEFRKIVAAARRDRPCVAILTDSPDFHLRLARKLHALGIPVVYLVAPQVWAWRKGRLPLMRRVLTRLLCIFPFEERFFGEHHIPASYIGHPLTRIVKASAPRPQLRERFRAPESTPLVALLPGSRVGEIGRHLPALLDAVERIRESQECIFALSLPAGFSSDTDLQHFEERFRRSSIKVFKGSTWDLLACADVALAASGTVTVEAALLGTPMVTFYRVTGASWLLGKLLVRVPFYSMVNLLAGRAIVPELLQGDMTGARIAAEALRLLDSPELRRRMKDDLKQVSEQLAAAGDPMEIAASVVEQVIEKYGQPANIEEEVHA
ncbi:MAG TPA: lipid-A-disaccharide synthase [Bryobacteraceae bacterium]|nr:lipid-A-disaccharide synthase [Bryobacteraceae bacterium]